AGLGAFISVRKDDFIGRSAALEEKESGGKLRLCTFKVEAADADAIGDEPIWHAGKVLGWVTSGGYAHTKSASIALGYVPKEVASETSGFEIEIIGDRRKATRLAEPIFDPKGERMRA
ncbi:MAG: aminomethyltransferase family protein, partial [Hyphomicrobiales bacterium]|nr:aminomethyltransferase family protein [Hyphomicrobiales bacterium]